MYWYTTDESHNLNKSMEGVADRLSTLLIQMSTFLPSTWLSVCTCEIATALKVLFLFSSSTTADIHELNRKEITLATDFGITHVCRWITRKPFSSRAMNKYMCKQGQPHGSLRWTWDPSLRSGSWNYMLRRSAFPLFLQWGFMHGLTRPIISDGTHKSGHRIPRKAINCGLNNSGLRVMMANWPFPGNNRLRGLLTASRGSLILEGDQGW